MSPADKIIDTREAVEERARREEGMGGYMSAAMLRRLIDRAEAARLEEREAIATWHDEQAMILERYARTHEEGSYEWRGYHSHVLEHARSAAAIRAGVK